MTVPTPTHRPRVIGSGHMTAERCCTRPWWRVAHISGILRYLGPSSAALLRGRSLRHPAPVLNRQRRVPGLPFASVVQDDRVAPYRPTAPRRLGRRG